MRKIIPYLLLLASIQLQAQKKPARSIPSAADVNKMMNDAMKQSGASPEELEAMKKMMGNMTAQAKEPTENLPIGLPGKFPRKDPVRIQQANQWVLSSNAQLASYLENLRKAVGAKLAPSVTKAGMELLNQFPSAYQTAHHYSNAAAGCWVAGYPQLGLWIAAQASVKNPGANNNALNNYAAMLTMLGAEQYAIPILNRLHGRFPANYSILNNLGQAWYGLGEFGKAKQYLDSAIIRFPGCAQALQSRAMLEDAQGLTADAIADMKAAARAAYTQERERALKKKGVELTAEDIPLRPAPTGDPLGLEKMIIPGYPHSRNECYDLKPKWDYFKNSLDALDEKLKAEEESLKGKLENLNQLRASMAGKPMNDDDVQKAGWSLPFATKAWLQKEKLMERMYPENVYGSDEARKKIASVEEKVIQLSDERDRTIREGLKSCSCNTRGEGDCVNKECACKVIEKGVDAFIDKSNALLEEANNLKLDYSRKYLNEDAYYSQFAMSDAEFALYQNGLKQQYVSLLRSIEPNLIIASGVPVLLNGPCNADLSNGSGHGLLDFDSLKCPIENSFRVPGIGSITLRCNQMTTEFAPMFLGVKGKYTENWWTGQVSNASFGFEVDVTKAVTVGVSVEGNFDKNGFVNGNVKVEGEVGLVGAGDHESGSPVQVGVSGTVGVTIEIDQNGISDVNVSGDVKAGAELETEGPKSLGKNTPGINLEGSWGINAGPSLEGKGTLVGMTVVQP